MGETDGMSNKPDGGSSDLAGLVAELGNQTADMQGKADGVRNVRRTVQHTQRRYKTLFELLPPPCVTVDAQGIVTDANRAAEEQFRLPRHDLRGRPAELLADAEHRPALAEFLGSLRHHSRHRRAEFVFRCAEGESFDGIIEAVQLPDDVIGEGALLCTITDVTERNRATEALRLANQQAEQARSKLEVALAAKTRFLAAASHDLRQPLQALSLFVGVLSGERRDSHEVVGRIQESVGALSELINSLLDISKLEAGLIEAKVTSFSAGDLMGRLHGEFATMAAGKGLKLRTYALDVPLRTDAGLLERILRNLLSNAVRYTIKGAILFGARRRGRHLVFEVWDSGIGIPEDQMELIFEDFHQVANEARNRQEGLGVGLAVVERLSRLLGCTVRVQSQLGRGSRFIVEIPMAVEVEQAAPQPPIMPPEGVQVLVVEDEPAVRQAMAMLLESWGWRVSTADKAEEALALVRQGARPMVALVDHQLNDGVSGAELLSELRYLLGEELTGVLLTGDTSAERSADASCRNLRLLHKPVQPERLRDILSGILTPLDA